MAVSVHCSPLQPKIFLFHKLPRTPQPSEFVVFAVGMRMRRSQRPKHKRFALNQ